MKAPGLWGLYCIARLYIAVFVFSNVGSLNHCSVSNLALLCVSKYRTREKLLIF